MRQRLGELAAWLALLSLPMFVCAIFGIGSDKWVWTMDVSAKWTVVVALLALVARAFV